MLTRHIITTASALLITITAQAEDIWPDQATTPHQLGPSDTAVLTSHITTADGATWVTWQDNICFADVRLQRLNPAGVRLQPDGMIIDEEVELCGVLPMFMAHAADNSVLVQAGGPFAGQPVQRVAPDGTMMWGADGFDMQKWGGVLGDIRPLDNGDVLLVGWNGIPLLISRIDTTGNVVWTSEIPLQTSSNRRIIGAIPDTLGGTFIIYDMPLAYTRRIDAVRIDQNGTPLWDEATVIAPFELPASRHSDPVAVPDGQGGVLIILVEGRESAPTPVPIRIQQLRADGTLVHDLEGMRISTSAQRQFDPDVVLDPSTGDLLIAWRDGDINNGSISAQRITQDGTRQWGEQGIHIADISIPSMSDWDMVWQNDTMTIVIADPVANAPTITARRVTGLGTLLPEVTPLSGIDRVVRSLEAKPIGNAVTASWFEETTAPAGMIVAQRLNPDNTLGLNQADITVDGVVDVADLLEVLAQWGTCGKQCTADIDDNGVVDTDDLLAVLAHWG